MHDRAERESGTIFTSPPMELCVHLYGRDNLENDATEGIKNVTSGIDCPTLPLQKDTTAHPIFPKRYKKV